MILPLLAAGLTLFPAAYGTDPIDESDPDVIEVRAAVATDGFADICVLVPELASLVYEGGLGLVGPSGVPLFVEGEQDTAAAMVVAFLSEQYEAEREGGNLSADGEQVLEEALASCALGIPPGASA